MHLTTHHLVKNPHSRCQEAIKENFYIRQYRSVRNSSEFSYYYHVFSSLKP